LNFIVLNCVVSHCLVLRGLSTESEFIRIN